jgi:RNA polymerase sigma factor (sigma-70 family)
MELGYRRSVAALAPQLDRFFSARVPDPHDAEELAQETIIRSLESELRFRGDASVRTWMFAIARNVLREYRRCRLHCPSELPTDECFCAPDTDHAARVAVSVAVAALPPHLRELYDLHYRQGHRICDCARLLARPVGTVKYQHFELRKRLRRML